jgi:hypothetical protein
MYGTLGECPPECREKLFQNNFFFLTSSATFLINQQNLITCYPFNMVTDAIYVYENFLQFTIMFLINFLTQSPSYTSPRSRRER